MPRHVDWTTMVDLASWNGLLAAVHPALDANGLSNRVPADARAAFREFHEQSRARRNEIAAQLSRVSAAMNAANIEPLWLKGAALVIEGSPWADRRWMSDIDVWVPPAHLDCAESALIAMGYRYDARQPDAPDHHLRPLFHPDEAFAIELHRALAPRAAAGIVTLDRVLANARHVEWRGTRVAIPGAADQLVHVASQARLSAAAFFRGRLKLRRVVEFCQLASDLGPAEGARALRSACAEVAQEGFAEEFLALAAGLCAFPGERAASAAMAGVAWKITFPRLHSMYFGMRALGFGRAVREAAHPRAFARKAMNHLRRAMDTRW